MVRSVASAALCGLRWTERQRMDQGNARKVRKQVRNGTNADEASDTTTQALQNARMGKKRRIGFLRCVCCIRLRCVAYAALDRGALVKAFQSIVIVYWSSSAVRWTCAIGKVVVVVLDVVVSGTSRLH